MIIVLLKTKKSIKFNHTDDDDVDNINNNIIIKIINFNNITINKITIKIINNN